MRTTWVIFGLLVQDCPHFIILIILSHEEDLRAEEHVVHMNLLLCNFDKRIFPNLFAQIPYLNLTASRLIGSPYLGSSTERKPHFIWPSLF